MCGVQSITGYWELWDVDRPLSTLGYAPCLNSQSCSCWHMHYLCRPPYPDLLSAPAPSSRVPARPPYSLSLSLSPQARLPLDAASPLLEPLPMEAGPGRHSWKFYKRSGRKAGRQTERFVRTASLSLFTCALVLYLYPCLSFSLSLSTLVRRQEMVLSFTRESKSGRKCNMRTVWWEINGQITKGRKEGADVTLCAAHDNAWKKTGRLQLFLSLSVTISAPSGKGWHTFWQGDTGLFQSILYSWAEQRYHKLSQHKCCDKSLSCSLCTDASGWTFSLRPLASAQQELFEDSNSSELLFFFLFFSWKSWRSWTFLTWTFDSVWTCTMQRH